MKRSAHQHRTRSSLGLAWLVPACLLAAGVVTVWLGGRSFVGGLTMALAFVTAGVLRLVLPESRAGALVVRTRSIDAATLFLLAAMLAAVFTAADLRPR